jgi:hypothetical protein
MRAAPLARAIVQTPQFALALPQAPKGDLPVCESERHGMKRAGGRVSGTFSHGPLVYSITEFMELFFIPGLNWSKAKQNTYHARIRRYDTCPMIRVIPPRFARALPCEKRSARVLPCKNCPRRELVQGQTHISCENSPPELIRMYAFDPGVNWPVAGNPLAMRSRVILDIVADNIKENGEGMIKKKS